MVTEATVGLDPDQRFGPGRTNRLGLQELMRAEEARCFDGVLAWTS
jgi:hypothetical protein